jgi:hypothetical protein
VAAESVAIFAGVGVRLSDLGGAYVKGPILMAIGLMGAEDANGIVRVSR